MIRKGAMLILVLLVGLMATVASAGDVKLLDSCNISWQDCPK